jgi:hypothetical protein
MWAELIASLERKVSLFPHFRKNRQTNTGLKKSANSTKRGLFAAKKVAS